MTHRPLSSLIFLGVITLATTGCVTNDVPAAPSGSQDERDASRMDADLDLPPEVDASDQSVEDMPVDMPVGEDLAQPDLSMDLGEPDMMDMPDLAADMPPDLVDMPEDMGACGGVCGVDEACVDDVCENVCQVQSAECGEVMHEGARVECGVCTMLEQGCVDNQCVDLCAASGTECGDVDWSGDVASCGACMGVDELCTDGLCQTGGGRWRHVVAGRAHTCAISQAGKVWCWGSNEQGQLGHPQTSMRALSPVETVNLGTVEQLDATDQHNCVVDASSLAWCWGDNTHGQIGNGQQLDRTSPYRITSLSNVTHMTTGSWHTCALLSDHSVRCVGYGQQGQVGDGSTNNSTAFRSVRKITEGAVGLDAGPAHSCVTTTEGALKCWGFNGVGNAYGRLGVGDTQSRVEPTVTMSVGWAHQVSSGDEHTCAVNQDREVWCWGDNTFGQLGVGGSNDRLNPQRVMGVSDVRRVASGEAHSCAVTYVGELYCWGRNDSGQLGIDSLVVQRTPQRVSLPGEVIGVHTGYQHTCAVTRAGELYCWGDNGSGQLGVGDVTRRLSPVLVP